MSPQPHVLPRWLVRLLTLTVVLNVLLAGAFVFGAFMEVRLSTRIHDSQVRACQDANVTRRQDVAIWNRLLNVPHPPRSAVAEIRELEALVRVKDTPVNCAALYRT